MVEMLFVWFYTRTAIISLKMMNERKEYSPIWTGLTVHEIQLTTYRIDIAYIHEQITHALEILCYVGHARFVSTRYYGITFTT